MAGVLESVARVGLAGWVRLSEYRWDEPPVLGMVGDELYLMEIDGANRESVLRDLIDQYEVGEGDLRIDMVFFGATGGVFASSMKFFELWPQSPADVPADVFVDDRYKAAFTSSGDEIIVSVRHALRPDGPPRRRLRFDPTKYEEAISELAREACRLRADLIALAQERAPHKLESLQKAFKNWPG